MRRELVSESQNSEMPLLPAKALVGGNDASTKSARHHLLMHKTVSHALYREASRNNDTSVIAE